MTNHFITTLMNLADIGETADQVTLGVGRQSFNGVLADVHLLLFPEPNNRAQVKFLAYCYLQVIRASGFDRYLIEKDTRVVYDLDQDFDHFYTRTFDTTDVLDRLAKRKAAVDRMFHDLPIEDQTPINLWSRHPNSLMRLTGVLVGFVQRAG